jgi:hypothetical protein
MQRRNGNIGLAMSKIVGSAAYLGLAYLWSLDAHTPSKIKRPHINKGHTEQEWTADPEDAMACTAPTPPNKRWCDLPTNTEVRLQEGACNSSAT